MKRFLIIFLAVTFLTTPPLHGEIGCKNCERLQKELALSHKNELSLINQLRQLSSTIYDLTNKLRKLF